MKKLLLSAGLAAIAIFAACKTRKGDSAAKAQSHNHDLKQQVEDCGLDIQCVGQALADAILEGGSGNGSEGHHGYEILCACKGDNAYLFQVVGTETKEVGYLARYGNNSRCTEGLDTNPPYMCSRSRVENFCAPKEFGSTVLALFKLNAAGSTPALLRELRDFGNDSLLIEHILKSNPDRSVNCR
ncbi:MAG: hypothetical protein AB7T49_17865 [Oligoflexales bacterium]